MKTHLCKLCDDKYSLEIIFANDSKNKIFEFWSKFKLKLELN